MTSSKTLAFAFAATLAPTVASAGGFDLTGQPIDIIFEEGNYIEGRVGTVVPDVEGSNPGSTVPNPAGGALTILGGSFGNTGDSTPFFTLGAKTDFTDRISGAVLFDTPYLRQTTYNDGIFEGTSARVEAKSITAIGRFKVSENFSVYGGPRVQFSSVDLQGPNALNPATLQLTPGLSTYDIDVSDRGFGFVVGAAAEIPKFKARLAVTYNSEIDHDFDSVETFATPTGTTVSFPSRFDIHTPQSFNVDLQAPLSTSTLLRANVRWVDWGGVDFTPPNFLAQTGRPVVEYTEDTITYRLTVAQRINENLAAFVTGSYEEDGGEEISLFKTVDGGFSLGGGVVIEPGNGLKLTLAGEYRWLDGINGAQIPTIPGTVTQENPAGVRVQPSTFDDPTAFGLSMKIGYSF